MSPTCELFWFFLLFRWAVLRCNIFYIAMHHYLIAQDLSVLFLALIFDRRRR